jgi:hypothetical protein
MAKSRKTDPITSKMAAEGIRDHITAIQHDVLEYARSVHDFIDTQLVAHFAGIYGPSTVRTRRCELVRRGLIRAAEVAPGVGKFRMIPPNTRFHTVWEATPIEEIGKNRDE